MDKRVLKPKRGHSEQTPMSPNVVMVNRGSWAMTVGEVSARSVRGRTRTPRALVQLGNAGNTKGQEEERHGMKGH